jgi:hypothetical protein
MTKQNKLTADNWREEFDERFYTMHKVHPPFGQIKFFISQLLEAVEKEVENKMLKNQEDKFYGKSEGDIAYEGYRFIFFQEIKQIFKKWRSK